MVPGEEKCRGRYFRARREAFSITATSSNDCATAAAIRGSHPVATNSMPTNVVPAVTDIVALGATLTNDGIVNPGPDCISGFSVATAEALKPAGGVVLLE